MSRLDFLATVAVGTLVFLAMDFFAPGDVLVEFFAGSLRAIFFTTLAGVFFAAVFFATLAVVFFSVFPALTLRTVFLMAFLVAFFAVVTGFAVLRLDADLLVAIGLLLGWMDRRASCTNRRTDAWLEHKPQRQFSITGWTYGFSARSFADAVSRTG